MEKKIKVESTKAEEKGKCAGWNKKVKIQIHVDAIEPALVQCGLCDKVVSFRETRKCGGEEESTYCSSRICIDCWEAEVEVCRACRDAYKRGEGDGICSDCGNLMEAHELPSLAEEYQCTQCERLWCNEHTEAGLVCPVCAAPGRRFAEGTK